ncbi:MAG: hypothetical protein KJ017_10925 [Alphaproteobacteria bacterium]|nr:hypothetical protein [Alphaproteobacteria bacterium]
MMTDREISEEAALSAEFETEAAGAPAPAVAPRFYNQQQQRPETDLDRLRAQQAMMQQQQL